MIEIRDGLGIQQDAGSANCTAECRFELSPSELSFYERNGWVGPFDALRPEEAKRTAKVCVVYNFMRFAERICLH